MSRYAVEALDDALDATKALLTPIDARQWLRLALVVFFLGGAGGGAPSASVGSSTGGPTITAPGPPRNGVRLPFSPEEAASIAFGALAVGLALGVAYVLVASVMEFVFVESLRRQHVRIRRYADQHLGRGLRLFGFRIALSLLVVVPAGGVVLAVLSAVGGEPRVSVGLLAVFVPLFIVLGTLVAFIDVFTTHFVVPVMVGQNVGVVSGWRRFWPTLIREWPEYGVYALVRIVLGVAVGVAASVVGAVVGAVVLVPIAVVGALTVPTFGSLPALLSNPVAFGVGIAILLGYAVVTTALTAVVLVPIQTYVRYHALLVLGDTNREFDLIPELRREIRAG
ncbi:DUF7544 domain-containing protein [Halorussus amylolyticus]|uniref:DUF7544 domain-containing protein n=1 Tax=Halorussus amylolyticus TaxID=1126242 RepID=UPI00104F4973|nr:hypothetical protein [Halorussus amylolyticus]